MSIYCLQLTKVKSCLTNIHCLINSKINNSHKLCFNYIIRYMIYSNHRIPVVCVVMALTVVGVSVGFCISTK